MNERSRAFHPFIGLMAALALGLALTTAAGRPAQAQKQRPPNFVIIFCDDLGYGDLSCYGAEKIKTPNLDQMAREGVKFTDFYVTASVCTPSRASLLTGRYQVRSGLTRVLFPFSKTGIEAQEITLAEALKERGYATACIGKWHLGHLPPFLPTRHGFDYYYGIPYSNDMHSQRRGDPPIPLMRNEEIIEQPAVQETLTERYTAEAIRFIREHKDEPFFVYLPHTMPHVPLYASQRFRGTSARGLYGDVVETIDWGVGEILKALRQEGLAENTLVIFTSDNGPWLIKKENGGSAGPLRAGKGTVYEGGVREPFIAWWPGTIPAGRVCKQPAISMDLFPTFLKLAGGRPSRERRLDGRNILGLLTGEGWRRGKTEFFFYRGQRLGAMRSGKWKLHLPGRVRNQDRPAELYDLKADLGERTNLAKQRPKLLERLLARAREFDAEAKEGAPPQKR